jgi:hypothetical protein
MKTRLLTSLCAVGLLLGLSFVIASPAKTNASPSTPAVLPQERHEAVHRAEERLREARELMAGLPGEYGGHRDKAIHKIDEAIAEVHEAWEHRER